MNILIICTYYPPDIAIAAKRPYMLAKYLGQMGHNVTVIRSGEINIKIDKNFQYNSPNVKVYSYLGEQSTAEKYARGEIEDFVISKKGRLSNLPKCLKGIIITAYNGITFPLKIRGFFNSAKKRSALLKNYIDKLEEKNFDVVFATYSNLENLYAGEYAAKKFGCKFIADFRDLMAQKTKQPFLEYIIKHKAQASIVKRANACTTVSDGLSKTLQSHTLEKKVFTLYNGYEQGEVDISSAEDDNRLSFCYTGSLYKKLSDTSVLFKVLSELEAEGKIERKNIVFNYAGSSYEEMLAQAKLYGWDDILVNHGFLEVEQTEKLQKSSDLFVVLTWNMKHNTGVLTGKFYEALKIKRPVVALVSGNKADSELGCIISQYNLGVCYEKALHKSGKTLLKEYILTQYNHKLNNEDLDYNPNQEIFERFEYTNIAKQIDGIIKEILNS